MTAYYNEFDPFAAAWLRELIADGLIAPGDVDERSIADVDPADLVGYTQCHFFAGIGGWSAALRLAGWGDGQPVWTGSAPCQPFSAAGKGGGHEDARHLWPAFYRLIAEYRPPVVFGEQVASGLGRLWLAAVRADLEGMGYAVGAADLCAASVGAPHIRQRLWWVADATGSELQAWHELSRRDGAADSGPSCDSRTRRLADRDGARCGAGRAGEASDGGDAPRVEPSGLCAPGGLGDADRRGRGQDDGQPAQRPATDGGQAADWGRGRSDAHPWASVAWLPCRDGKARPVESAPLGMDDGLFRSLGRVRHANRAVTFPIIHGAVNRVGRLRGYGNAIVPPVAAAFVRAYMECRP